MHRFQMQSNVISKTTLNYTSPIRFKHVTFTVANIKLIECWNFQLYDGRSWSETCYVTLLYVLFSKDHASRLQLIDWFEREPVSYNKASQFAAIFRPSGLPFTVNLTPLTSLLWKIWYWSLLWSEPTEKKDEKRCRQWLVRRQISK